MGKSNGKSTPSFNAQAFLDSAGLSKTIVEYGRSESIFSQGDRCESVLLLLARYGKQNKPRQVVPKISQETLSEMVGTIESPPGTWTGSGSNVYRHQLQACRLGKVLLASIESDEVSEPELERRGDMKEIEGAAPHRRRAFPADLAGTSERRAPQDIGLHIAAFGHILVKGGQCIGQCVGAHGSTKGGKADAVDDFQTAMLSDRERSSCSCSPRAHCRRFRFVNV